MFLFTSNLSIYIFCCFISHLGYFSLCLTFFWWWWGGVILSSFSILSFFLPCFSHISFCILYAHLIFISFVCAFPVFNLLLVTIHELGHSLGLWHFMSQNSIVYPRYVYQNPRTFHLDVDDIQKIQQLWSVSLEGRGI
ncbi:matrix metallopeptidase 26 [Phyllostomus discolor]|uniref:Matrix metallopeptidase 26 n=1 Tax=Phyllostomus discolor TaxID=89673 RepID=A0A834A378_9CHIR|nr:matrix metallopeptidase 26 [Phyllostomus discolor]